MRTWKMHLLFGTHIIPFSKCAVLWFIDQLYCRWHHTSRIWWYRECMWRSGKEQLLLDSYIVLSFSRGFTIFWTLFRAVVLCQRWWVPLAPVLQPWLVSWPMGRGSGSRSIRKCDAWYPSSTLPGRLGSLIPILSKYRVHPSIYLEKFFTADIIQGLVDL